MYVCLCMGVSDKKILEAIKTGHDTVKKIRSCTGAASQCCKCLPDIKEILEAELATQGCSESQMCQCG